MLAMDEDDDEAVASGQLGLFPVVLDLWRSSLPQVVSRGELWFFCGLHLIAWGETWRHEAQVLRFHLGA